MRDKFADPDHFDNRLNSLEQSYEGKDILEHFKDMYLDDSQTDVDANGFRQLKLLRYGLLRVQSTMIPLKFSRGDELSNIYDCNFSEMVDHYHYFSEELSKGNPEKIIYGVADQVRDITDQYSVYVWLAWCLCFETNFEKIRDILPQLCAPGQDRLTDWVCASLVEDWPIADGAGLEKAFGLLDKALSSSSSEERIEIIERYLQDWPKYVGQIKGGAIGFNAYTTSKNSTLDDLLKGMSDHYVGFWSWEVALIVKLFGIDDSSFKDRDFYPYDLVHFTPSLSDQGLLVSEFGDLNTVAAKRELTVLAEQRKDLTIKLERDSFDNIEFEEEHAKPGLYHAYLPKKGVSTAEDFDFIVDSAVRYCAYLTKNVDEIQVAKDELVFVKSEDDWLVRDRLAKNMNELIDECGMSETYPFMEEVFLRLNNDYADDSLIYCSRHKDGQVPPLMILRYAKFFDDQMLFIYCMVRDEKLTYNDVAAHWLWCIDRYSELLF